MTLLFPCVDRPFDLEYKTGAMRFLSVLILFLSLFFGLPPQSALAVVEISSVGQEPVVIEDVYQRQGTSFMSIDEVLAALEMEGRWDSVAHTYRIRTAHGWAVISPGSQFLKLGEDFVPIVHRPRFIDGKLRVSEPFILQQLAPLLTTPLQYRNHNPPTTGGAEDPLDRLFAFLLRRKPNTEDPSQWTVALDPGHGGTDAGVLGLDGSKEKEITLAVAKRVERLLKMHQDAPVQMTRDDDYAVETEQRLQTVAQAQADVMLSLHAQGFLTPDVRGIMLFIQPETERDLQEEASGVSGSRRLAEALSGSLTTAGFLVTGITEQPVLPLGRGDLPRVLVEMGSMTQSADLAMLHDPTRQQDMARALFDGLQTFFKENKDPLYDVSSAPKE